MRPRLWRGNPAKGGIRRPYELLAMTQKGFFNKTFRFAKPRLKSEINLVEKKIQITNRLGLHARPAVLVVQLANKFKSEIKLEKEGVEVNAKSIMGVMMLAAEKGSFLLVKAEGEDEKEATEKLAELFDSRFGED